MDSIFKIGKKNICGITVTGLEKDNDEYLNDSIISFRNYTYEETVTINILKHVNSKEEEVLESYKILPHNVDCIDECDMDMNQDGLYSVYHIILPNKTWLDNILETSEMDLNSYNIVYYVDNDKIMKYIKGAVEEVDINEILEVNELVTTIIKGVKNTFQLCHLMKCFYKLCSNLLTQLPERCPSKFEDLDNLRQYRDIFWMAINVIKYLLERGQYLEASRILENITQCNQICGNNEKITLKSCNCG